MGFNLLTFNNNINEGAMFTVRFSVYILLTVLANDSVRRNDSIWFAGGCPRRNEMVWSAFRYLQRTDYTGSWNIGHEKKASFATKMIAKSTEKVIVTTKLKTIINIYINYVHK